MASRLRVAVAVTIGLIVTVQAAVGQPTFTDVTTAAGINPAPFTPALNMTGGAAAGDVDGDGRVDLFITRQGLNDLLYLNNGNGTFSDASITAGFTALINSNGAAMGDIDNDGDLDLYVTTVHDGRNYLYINDGSGHFTEEGITRNAAVDRPGQLPANFSAAFGDYDNDGHLDLYTSEWGGASTLNPGESSARLLRNLGGGTFTDATIPAGVELETGPPPGQNTLLDGVYAFSPRFSDLDRDGHVDLTIASDFGNSRLFWNNGDGTFTDGSNTAQIGTDENGMGSTIADFDGDGQLDWFVTAIYDPNETCETVNCDWGYAGNRLYRNNGDRTFTDSTDLSGVRDGGWGWGASFFDYDNDGDQDLIMTNGIDFGTPVTEHFVTDRSVIWENDGAGQFTDVSNTAGITDTASGKGLLTFDYDEDGDLDVFIVNNDAPPILYRNDGGNDNDWLRVKTVGSTSNLDGVGAFITVTPDLSNPDDSMVWEVNASSDYLAQSEMTAHFGLGPLSGAIDLVTVEWPTSGLVQQFTDVTPNTLLTAAEPLVLTGDANNDGQVTAADLIAVQQNFGNVGPADGLLLGDANDDGQVTGADLISVQQNFGNVLTPAPGSVPEPATAALLALGAMIATRRRADSLVEHLKEPPARA